MSKLPQGWVECKLEDFVTIMDNYRKPVNSNEREQRLKKATQTYPYYGATGQVGLIDDYIFEEEAVLLGEDGAPFLDPYKNKAYLVSGRYWVNNHAHILQGLGGISNKFICYLLNSISYFQYVSGTTRLKLNQTALKQIKCNLPPLNEQKRIVEKIEEEFGKIDEGVEKLKLAQEQIRQYRQSVLKSAFEGKLTGCEIKLIVLSDAGEIVTGTTPSTKVTEYYNSHDFPFYKPTDLNNGYNTNSAICYVSKSAYENHRKLPINSILVTCIGATIGKTGIIRESGICNQQINAIIPNKEFIPEYIYFQCISDYFQEQIKVNASATTLPILNKSGFSKLKFLTCKLNEQKQIVKEIEKRFEVADEVERVITENLEKAEQLKQSILKKAFEGRFVPQDPTDQPASELLAQIQAERSK